MRVNRKIHALNVKRLHRSLSRKALESQEIKVSIRDTHVRDLGDSDMNAWMGNEPPMTKGEIFLDTVGSAVKVFSTIVSGIIHLPIYLAAAVINKIAELG